MRVQNPDQFATVLLGHDQGWNAARVNSAMHGNIDSNKILLKQHIPVYLTYFTAQVGDDGKFTRYNDLYGHDRRMIAALNGGSVPYGLPGSEEVAESTQRPVVRRSNRGQNGDFEAITRALFDF
jgi:hypothetical protein